MPPQIVIVTGPAEAASARELIRETGLNAGVIEAADETAVSAVQAAFEENGFPWWRRCFLRRTWRTCWKQPVC